MPAGRPTNQSDRERREGAEAAARTIVARLYFLFIMALGSTQAPPSPVPITHSDCARYHNSAKQYPKIVLTNIHMRTKINVMI